MKILTNAAIRSMDGEGRTFAAMVWDRGRIVELGAQADLLSAYPHAETIDARGAVVLPGFIDPHIHFVQGVLYRRALDCSAEAIPTRKDLAKRLTQAAAQTPADHWIIGQGYDPLAWPDRRAPTRQDLDAACPHHPVVIFHYSFHECVANSLALSLAGIDKQTSEPFAGEIHRDGSGRLTGRLVETAMAPVHRHSQTFLLTHHREEVLRELGQAQKALFACGITRIGDPAVDTGIYRLYADAFAEDHLQLPVVIHFCSDRHMFLLPWDVLERSMGPSPDARMIHGPLKIFLDGADRAAVQLNLGQFALTGLATLWRSLCQASLDPLRAAGRSPVCLGKGVSVQIGTLLAETGDCIDLVRRATFLGFPLAFHAIGNRAVRQAVEIIQQVARTEAFRLPPRIEHGLFMDEATLRAIRDLGVAVVTQPTFLSHMDPVNLPCLPGLLKMPLRSLIEAGILVAGSSDWPVASHDPLTAVAHAITRQTVGGHRLAPQEAIELDQAMQMYTIQAAKVLGCDGEVGSLQKGKRADFVVLDGDPYGSSHELGDQVRVRQTWMGGEKVYDG